MGAALLFLTLTMGMASVFILRQMENKIQTQIQLDQLTGSIAIQLRASIITVEDSKKRLRIAKVAMIAGCIDIFACPAFKRAYELYKKIEIGIQKLAEQNWNAQKIKWLAYHPFFSRKSSIPTIEELSQQNSLILKIKRGNLISASKLWKTEGTKSNGWKIAWVE